MRDYQPLVITLVFLIIVPLFLVYLRLIFELIEWLDLGKWMTV